MNALFLNNLLLRTQIFGLFGVLFLFAFCFLGIHLCKLVQLGWEAANKTPAAKEEPPKEDPKEPPKEKAPASQQEPIYYLVERKKRPPKNAYAEPKKITFK